MQKKLSIILLSSIVVFLGFFRDYIFYNINWIYKTLTVNRRNQAMSEFHFLLEWSPTEIMWLKWVLTMVFYGLFFLMTFFTLKLAFKNKSYNRITAGLFLSIFLISGLLYAIGYITGSLSTIYGIVRTLMGMAQSFVPLMILGVLFKFNPEERND